MAGRIVMVLDRRLQDMFRAALDRFPGAALCERIEDAVGAPAEAAEVLVVPGNTTVSHEILEHFPRLRALISPFTGIEGFDISAASARGVAILNGQSRENVESLAEATVLMLLAALYDLRGTELVLRENRPRPSPPAGRMLGGMTVGIIGFGQVGRSVARRLASWGVTLVTHTRTPPADPDADVTFVSLSDLIDRADIILLLAGLNAGSRHMLDAEMLQRMKPDAVLVNMGRGGLVDEQALAELLAQRPAMRAALDVFEVEPLPLDSPLRLLPNVLLTPHMLSHTREAVGSLPGLLIDNITAALGIGAPPRVCNPDVLPDWLSRRPVRSA